MNSLNVIYLHTHDTGRFIEPYDPGIRTPNLTALAGEGTLFRNAHCVGPTCSPSRSALLTGKYPHENGMLGLAHRGFSLRDYEEHLARYLRSCGFETALFGMQHEAADPAAIGYETLFIDPRREGEDRWLWDSRNADAAVGWILSGHDRPFFLSFGLEMTHRPFPVPESTAAENCRVPYGLPDRPETRRDWAGFLAAAAIADREIGRVLQALRDAGLRENSVILYTTDHGAAFPDRKCTLYDGGTGVSLILSVPGRRECRVSDAMVSHLDVFPTLCELLELPEPDGLRGKSLLPLLDGKTDSLHEALFGEINYHAARDPQRSVRTERFKYIRRFGGPRPFPPCNIDAGPSKEFFAAAGYLDRLYPEEQLFDLYLDPGEKNDLAGDPAYRQTLLEMRALLHRHLTETCDTIETEGLPFVPGTVVNRCDCYDAELTAPECLE